MNYINEDKKIRHLEESIRELEKKEKKSDLEQLKKWKRSLLLEWKMIQDIDEWNSLVEERNDLLEENKKLKFDIEARKEMKKAREEKVRFLEESLDKKEILNATYREEINKLRNWYM